MLIAYLNLVHVETIIDQNAYKVLGIGNVCVDKRKEHIGIGALMMNAANVFIKLSNSCGLLLCRDKLIPFYEKVGWKRRLVPEITVAQKNFGFNVMFYDPFLLLPGDIRRMSIDRSF